MKRLAILGGGITGLTLAYLLQDRFEVILIEKSERLGGWIQTKEIASFLFELGPRGFRPQGEGKATLDLCKRLGLEPLACNESAQIRYVLKGGKLKRFGLPYLIQCGLFSSIWKDLWQRPQKREDETLRSFFTRHLHPKMVEGVIDPIVKGIFGGDLDFLSIESCFPALKQKEESAGSLIRGMLKKKQKHRLPALYSFEGGMQRFIDRLEEKLTCRCLLNTEVKTIEKGFIINQNMSVDSIISTLPLAVTGALLSHPFEESQQSLTTVSMGFSERVLKKKGFGYLVPHTEGKKYLGMTWDSHIFAKPDKKQEQVCVMIKGALAPREAKIIALEALREIGVEKKPATLYVHQARAAVAQFGVNHKQRVSQWKEGLPEHFFVCGSFVEGKGVNGCIDQAHRISASVF